VGGSCSYFSLLLVSQIFEHWWFKVNYPVWCVMIVYAALYLILIYTYQFQVVSNGWSLLYNKTNLASKNVTEAELLVAFVLKYIDVLW